jgi:hypothetical protein|tara:strand:- start:58 stop:453 length:396 start_codon:yes stop_codon:yes gene_type:complete
MAEYLTVALLSIMIFYSFGIAFNVHKTLDKENAGKLLRKLFPLYFLWGIIISIFIEVTFLYQGTSLKALLIAIVAIGFLYSRQVLVPLLNKNRDLVNEGNEEAKKAFGSLHLRSVSINLVQMLLLIIVLFI